MPVRALQISIDHLLEGVQIIGKDWTYRYVNRTAAQQGERTPGELIGRTMMECYPGIDDTPLFKALSAVMRDRNPARIVNEFALPSGSTRWFELLVEPVPDGLAVLSIDVTDRRSAELQLRHAMKMEAIGQLAGGVAHDFNNLLTAILGCSELVSDALPPDSPALADVEQIMMAAGRAAALTRQLLAFSRHEALQIESLRLNEVIADVLPMIRRLLPETIALRTSLSDDVHAVEVDRGELQQVLVNLVINARDAMPDGGEVLIATRNEILDQDYVERHPGLAPGSYAVFSVTDTGTGIPPELRARIFDPFFTTKEKGKGTGLGLAAAQRLVQERRGHIHVYSEVGHGAVFRVYLPAAQPSERMTEAASSAPPAPARPGETVYVVEDDTLVRELAQRVLVGAGYRVVVAPSGERALESIAREPEAVSLLLTDVMLSGMSGQELALKAGALRPGLPTLFMSGYAERGVGPLPAGATLLRKPFSAHELVQAIRAALDRER